MTPLVLVSLVILIVAFVMAVYYTSFNEQCYKTERIVKLRWRMIKKLYPIKPERWSLKSAGRGSSSYILAYWPGIDWGDSLYIHIRLSFIDWIKFCIAKRNYKQKKKKKEATLELEKLLSVAQQDIRSLQERVQREREESLSILRSIR